MSRKRARWIGSILFYLILTAGLFFYVSQRPWDVNSRVAIALWVLASFGVGVVVFLIYDRPRRKPQTQVRAERRSRRLMERRKT